MLSNCTFRRILIVFCLLMLQFGISKPADNPERVITIIASSPSLPPDSVLYITGNHPDLGDWQPHRTRMEFLNGRWQKALTLPDGFLLEYKFTRGSWRSEAVDSSGLEFPNYQLAVKSDSSVSHQIPGWRDLTKGETRLSMKRLEDKSGHIELIENWKYQAGDNPDWASPAFDDGDWQGINTRQLTDSNGNERSPGIGWFRLRVTVDSSLWHIPLALDLYQAGASEIYLNGELLFQTGAVGNSPADEAAYFERDPRIMKFPARRDQLLAVRYSNFSSSYFANQGLPPGFDIGLGAPDQYIKNRTTTIRALSIYQLVFSMIPLTLALVHLLLFFFNRPARENLFYAICMIGFAVLSLTNFQFTFVTEVARFRWIIGLSIISAHVAIIFGLLTAYTHVFGKLQKQYLAFVIASLALLIGWFFIPARIFGILNTAFIALAGIELMRVIIFPGRGHQRDWLLGGGFIVLILAIFYQLLVDAELVNRIFGLSYIYVYGVLIFSITMSTNLARDFARMHSKILDQERQVREQIISRRILEADNARKTRELEEARQLQLSMLPADVPHLPGLNIAAYMKTATEVGGDYYDFKQLDDGTLIIAVGDATGHGTRAGIMVTLIKSLFNSMGNTFYLPDFFRQVTRNIKQMKLGNLYMAMMLVRIRGNHLTATVAGMPPILIYRSKNQHLEEILIKGLPLGGVENFAYQQEKTTLEPGDTILLMSDGFPELFNKDNQILDYDRAKEIFKEVAVQTPQEILDHLVETGKRWRGGQSQNDDITFVVLKVASEEKTSEPGQKR